MNATEIHTETWYELEYLNCGEWYSSSEQSMDTLESARKRLADRRELDNLTTFQWRLVKKTLTSEPLEG
jgi:hypothetical protein